MKNLKQLMFSFRCAGAGIRDTIRRERNIRIHLCAVVFVIIFGIWQRLSPTHWALELLCCGVVIALELINTALENICDLICREKNETIRRCKDAAAGAVLVVAFISAVLWLILILGTPEYRKNLAGQLTGSVLNWVILGLWLSATVAIALTANNKRNKGDKQ